MSSQRASLWVTYLYHNWRFFTLFVLLLSVVLGLGFVRLNVIELWPWRQIGWMLLTLVAVSVVSMRLMDSMKTGGLLGLMAFYVILITLAGLSWLGLMGKAYFLLGAVVLITLTVSHGVHFLSALHREMARGLFQQEAMSEALSMTHRPILFSTLTTVLGFVMAAWVNPQLLSVAIMVLLGGMVSYLSVVLFLPLILMRFFLEFRVGHYEDRHGLGSLANRMEKQPGLVYFVLMSTAAVTVFSALGLALAWSSPWAAPSLMLGGLAVLLTSGILGVFFWRALGVAISTVVLAALAMTWVLGILAWWMSWEGGVFFQSHLNGSALVLLAPLGIVLDDAIHFFERYQKARQRFITDPYDQARFALKSVGRPIWVTSQVLTTGLLLLSLIAYFEGWAEMFWAATVTWLATLAITFLLVMVVPAWWVRKRLK